MQKRKSHNKSRNGCLNCKKRHVKCDERGPPCANCIVRESTDTCTYVGAHQPPRDNDSGSSRSNSSEILKLSPRSPPSECGAAAESRRLLELELMHQWSTSTYKSLCSSYHDDPIMQVQVPRWSLKHDFLLNGIFAIAALELAIVETGKDEAKLAFYVQAAMEYYDKGSASFRAQLGNINEENSTALYMFSSLAWIISMGIPHDRRRHYHEKTILQRTSMLMELIMGSSLIALRSVTWIMSGGLSASIKYVIASFLEEEGPNALDIDVQAAFMRLMSLAENGPATAIAPGTYQNAVMQLRVCWKEEAKDTIKGIAMAFPSLAAQDFAVAVSESEPMALLILMHWAVLLDKLDRVDKLWWAKSVGEDLMIEISDRLLESQSEVATMPEFWESVAWAREKVGLPAFVALQL